MWMHLGTTVTQPQSGKPRKMTEWGQCMLKRTVRRSHQLSAESIAKDLQTSCVLQISTTERRELHGMGFSCIPALRHQMQCKASDAEVKSTPPLDSRAEEPCSLE
ncbi:unnamed protein product [Staurois parvus]|uniref:Uncharacterized protein n=1 Tax=Staurois parvus TaxID=386267 RepID=A0ABN9CJA8_9NEOB|nr:unnamed protein product [Staurois parvus]